jgi:orotate phosphoribosyltransferase
VTARQGHFRLESGHHGRLWLDLDGLFADPARVAPLVDLLAAELRAHGPEIVCGPLVGGAFLAQTVSAALQVQFAYTERAVPAGREGLFRAEYRLPAALNERVRGKRVAIVDDVVSAGSAVRGTYRALEAQGARPCAVGALLVLGTQGAAFVAQQGLPVAALARQPYDLWMPAECPLCVSGAPLEDPAGAAPTPS